MNQVRQKVRVGSPWRKGSVRKVRKEGDGKRLTNQWQCQRIGLQIQTTPDAGLAAPASLHRMQMKLRRFRNTLPYIKIYIF